MAAPDTAVNVQEKLDQFTGHWSPKIIAEANGWEVKLVKAKGTFDWHKHVDTDEIFMVLSGGLEIQMRDRAVPLTPGDIFVVPRGVEHRPDAGDGCEMLLLEPGGVKNTGDVQSAKTAVDEWV